MNIGTCGCGTIASWISDFLTQMDNDSIVKYGVASRNEEKSRAFAEKYGWQKVYPGFDELIADPAVDLVYICLPNQLHYDLCMKALRGGKNVVCEKPFAVNDKQAAEMLALAEEKGVNILCSPHSAYDTALRLRDAL